jgi:hypothetical protein
VTPVGGNLTYEFRIYTDPDVGCEVFEVGSMSHAELAVQATHPAGNPNSSSNYNFQSPDKLFVYGENDWAFLTIRYGFNQYRHVYMGTLHSIGNVGFVDVIGGSNSGYRYGGRSEPSYFKGSEGLRPIFMYINSSDYYEDRLEVNRRGGVYVVHSDLTQAVKPFKDSEIVSVSDWPDHFTLCRYHLSSGVDELCSLPPVPGGSVLIPYPMYVIEGQEENLKIYPLGTVKGVRYVNLNNLNPEEERVVGVNNWKMFPELSKQSQHKWEKKDENNYVFPFSYSYETGVAVRVVG